MNAFRADLDQPVAAVHHTRSPSRAATQWVPRPGRRRRPGGPWPGGRSGLRPRRSSTHGGGHRGRARSGRGAVAAQHRPPRGRSSSAASLPRCRAVTLWNGILWLHLIAMAFFVGGQLMLAAVVVPVLRGREDGVPLRAAARRFGYGTVAAIVVLVLTGAAMAGHLH